jgi:LysR family transcriptional regulator, glycine cleavage system transcriptional activator
MRKIHLKEDGAAPARAIPPLAALLAFQRAGSLLSFRRAARDLALSPSAVSHQIRGLEDRFGVQLFARGGRTIRLTADGERYLQSVSAALATLDDASRELLRQSRRGHDELRISSLPFFTSAVMIPALAAFKRDYPDMTLRIEATHQYADFERSGVDVAIRYGREHAANLRLEPLLDVSSLPVCAPQLRALLRRPDDLAKATLIHVGVQPRAWQVWLSDAGVGGLTPKDNLWFDNAQSAIEAAERGLGVVLAMHPLIMSRDSFGRRLIAPFDVPVRRAQTLYLVSRIEQAKDKRIRAFRRWLTDAVRQASQT